MHTAAQQSATLQALLEQGGLDVSAIHQLADRIIADHDAAPAEKTAASLKALAEHARTSEQQQAWQRQKPNLQRRLAAGRVRRVNDGGAQDVLYALAEPLTALIALGRSSEANMLANRYLDVSPQGATGWAALPLFLSMRASDIGNERLAEALLLPREPRLVAIGGLAGTGKSSLSRLLGSRIGRPPGARVLRSDVFRKRLAGVSPETKLPPSHYTLRSDEQTYEALFESADDHLACGSSVIIDSVFMKRHERDVVEAMAIARRVPFTGLWLEAPERDRIARAMARTSDASDATADVVREQSRRTIGTLGGWHRMRTNRPIEAIVPAARAVLERRTR
jgi:uncharacterized protein